MKTPCMKCEKRKLYCHSTCEEYKAFQVENEKRKKRERAERDGYFQLSEQVRNEMNRRSRKKRNRGI